MIWADRNFRPEFKSPTKVEMAFSQKLPLNLQLHTLSNKFD